MATQKERRRHQRLPYFGPIRVSWEDARGETRYVSAKCVDISESGLRIEVGLAIPSGSVIHLNADRIGLRGAAVVKHAERSGARSILGLAFTGAAERKIVASFHQSFVGALTD